MEVEPTRIAGILATLTIVLAGFAFVIIAQETREERLQGSSVSAFATFGLSFLGLIVASFVSAVIVGEREGTERAFVLEAVNSPLVVSSILLVLLDTVVLLEMRLDVARYAAARILAAAIVLISMSFFVVTMLDMLAVTQNQPGSRAAQLPWWHVTWITGCAAVALCTGAATGWFVRRSLRVFRDTIFVLTVLACGLAVAVVGEAFSPNVKEWQGLAVAVPFTVIGAIVVAAIGAVHLQELRGRGRIQPPGAAEARSDAEDDSIELAQAGVNGST